MFTYSEEEGTYGADALDDNVAAEVKENRREEVMLLQQKINHKKNLDLVGTTQRVLIDMCNSQGVSFGRTYRDSPEIDNYVKIKEEIDSGVFCDVKITEAEEHDLVGERC